jgi:diguanylate cyclase (GGDEF)-like protein/PAS domain S-box-containing protein
MNQRDAMRAEFSALLAASGETLLLIRDGHVVRAFGQAALGYDESLPTGGHIAEYAHPDDVPIILEFVEHVRDGHELKGDLRLRARTGDGGWALTEGSIRDHRDDPNLQGVIIRLRLVDVADAPTADEGDPPLTKRADAAAPSAPAASDEFTFPSAALDPATGAGTLASLAEVVPAAILATDLLGFVVYSNAATHEVLGRPGEELSGAGWRSIVHPDDVDEVARTSLAALRGESRERLFRITHPDGERWILGRFAPLRPAERITGLVAAFDDVTTQRAVEHALAHRATHDPLTELPNRSLLVDRLRGALGRADRSTERVAVLFIDLDGFKAINDQLGHAHGDRVLVRVAQRLSTAIRPPDTVARLGGDEFVVVCEGLDEEGARHLANRLQQALALPPQPQDTLDAQVATIGASIGIALVLPSTSPEEALHHADHAMYRAKQNGPGGVELVSTTDGR